VNVSKYHIYIEYEDSAKSGIRFNISQEELVRTFVTPFTAGQPFWFMGKLLNPLKTVKVVLFWSYENADKLTLPSHESLVICKDKKYLIENILKGKIKGAYICTEKYLPPTQKNEVSSSGTVSGVPGNIRRRIFVVSGSDEEMKQATAKALTKLGLAPVIMREQPRQGKKIVECFEDYSDVDFAVILLSPDDYAFSKDDAPAKRVLRPKQDVIFTFGFILGKLSKSKVLAFYRECENFEAPTDYEGIRFIAFDDRDSWKLALIRELNACGHNVDANAILK
jgi:predicted nucleotide-binding protein